MAERIQYLAIKIDNNDTILLDSTTRSYDISNLTAGEHTATITAICKEHGTATTKSITFTVAGSSADGGTTGGGTSSDTRNWSVLIWDNSSNPNGASDDITFTVAGSKTNGTYICINDVHNNDYFSPDGGNYVLNDQSESVTINGETWKIVKIDGHSWENGSYTTGNFGTYYCNSVHRILMLDNKVLNASSIAEIKAYAT